MAANGTLEQYVIADLLFDPGRQLLTREGREIPLSTRLARLLLVLVERAPATATHDRIADRVWGERRIVSPENIAQHIAMLRKLLGDDAASPRYIAAVRGEGYRLVAQVHRHSEDSASGPRHRRSLWTLLSLIPVAAVIGWIALEYWQADEPAADNRALVVLPFKSLSADSDDQYFADGLTEELINRLSRVEGLLVFGRTTSFALRSFEGSHRRIATSTGATHALEGSVRRDGNQIRIGAQLISTATGLQTWSRSWTSDVGDMLDVQLEIAGNVAGSLDLVLTDRSLSDQFYGLQGTDDREALEQYLIALGLVRAGGTENILRAEELLRSAIERDSEFIAARGMLARTLGTLRFYQPERSGELLDEWNRAVDLIRVAAPDHPAAPIGLGLQRANQGDWVSLEEALVDALETLPPGPLRDETESLLVYMRQTTGQFSATLSMLSDAKRRDPLSLDYSFDLQRLYYSLGDLEAAEDEYRRSLDLPGVRTVVEYMALMRAIVEDYGNGEVELRLDRLVEASPGLAEFVVPLVGTLEVRERALEMVRDKADASDPGWLISLAWWADYLGDSQLAIQLHRDYLDRVRRAGPMIWLPFLSEMRQTPEFLLLAGDFGLVSYWQETGNWGDFCRPDGGDIVCQ